MTVPGLAQGPGFMEPGLILSTTGGFSANGASGAAEDLIVFAATSLGASTAGGFTLLFDGSDVGLTGTSENVDAVARTLAGDILLSTTAHRGVSQEGARPHRDRVVVGARLFFSARRLRPILLL